MGYAQYSFLKSFKNRDPQTLWCFDTEQPNYNARPKNVSVWFRVYYPERDKYNILIRTVHNENNIPLSHLLAHIRTNWWSKLKDYYARKYQLETLLEIQAEEIIAITPFGKD